MGKREGKKERKEKEGRERGKGNKEGKDRESKGRGIKKKLRFVKI